MLRISYDNDKHNLLFLAILGLVVCAPALLNGFPNSYDIQNALVSFTQFSSQLFAGDLYPRWLYGLYNGYGAPMFYYYAPLPFYLECLIQALSLFTASPYLVLGLTATAMVITSAFACYFWLRDSFENKKALIGAAAYTLLPYHIVIDLYVRGSLTELFTFTWLPLCLLFIQRSLRGEPYGWLWLALSYALLLLSSVPIALATTPLLILYSAYLAYNSGKKEAALQKASPFLGLLCGFGLSGFYIITAFLMRDYISAEKFWSEFYAPENWFLCGVYCADTLIPDFMQKISWIVALEFLTIIALGLTTIKKFAQYKSTSLFWLVMAIGALFMMSETSAFLWHYLPLMESIQFPWRLTIIFDLALAYFVALKLPIEWKTSGKELHISLILACLLFSYSYNNIMNVSYALPTAMKAEIETAIDNGKYLDMYLPKDSNLTLEQVMSDESPINYEITHNGIVLNPEITEPANITTHQFYFPSWHAVLTLDGKDFPLKIHNDKGKAVIQHPGGDGTIFLTHRMMTEEKVGLGMSIVTLLFCAGAVLIIRKRRLHH